MRYIQLVVVLLLVVSISICYSALIGQTEIEQIIDYSTKIAILKQLLFRNCGIRNHVKRSGNEVLSVSNIIQKLYYERLREQYVLCSRATTTRTTTTTTVPSRCPKVIGGYTQLYIQFISYSNPSNLKADGKKCGNSTCDIAVGICLSPLNAARTCSYYYKFTDVPQEGSHINFYGKLGQLENPVRIDLSTTNWQGAKINIKIWHKHRRLYAIPYDLIDNFDYELRDPAGSTHNLVQLDGSSHQGTKITVMFSVLCPQLPTTTPTTTTSTTTTPTTTTPTTTTTTTAPTTTTATTTTPTTTNPLLANCLSATNLTESWRQDHKGSNIRGAGSHSFRQGYACDFRSNLQWFRFTRNAGTRMLNQCPEALSCGTENPFWTDALPPKQIGVVDTTTAYGVYGIYCYRLRAKVEVMRCGPSDLIYRYIDDYYSPCSMAFCGMP